MTLKGVKIGPKPFKSIKNTVFKKNSCYYQGAEIDQRKHPRNQSQLLIELHNYSRPYNTVFVNTVFKL